MKIAVINGPNLNLLGKREPDIYGHETLEDIQKSTEAKLMEMGFKLDIDWYQSNIEGELVSKIQEVADGGYDFLVINPAAYTHTSVALYDALRMVNLPVIEVHLSNTYSREEFRTVKLTSKASTIIMEGLKNKAYLLGILSQLIK